MLQGGDRLGIRVEATNEFGVGGNGFVDDLDGYVAFDAGLEGPEDDPGRSRVDLLQEPVAAEGLSPQIQSRILLQDALVKPYELRRGVDAQLVRQDLPDPLVRPQRLRLSPLSVEGQHEEAPQALPPRVSGDQGLQLPDGLGLNAGRQEPFDPGFLSLEAELIESGRLGEERGLLGEVAEGRPPPQAQRVLERRDGHVRIHREAFLRVSHERVESRSVQLGGIEPQAVAGSVALDPVVTEGLPEVRDVGLDHVAGLLGWLLRPDLVDQRLGGHELVRTKNQVREDGALLGPAKGDGVSPHVHLERAEDPEQRHAVGIARDGGAGPSASSAPRRRSADPPGA
jgi:hypothetical protein